MSDREEAACRLLQQIFEFAGPYFVTGWPEFTSVDNILTWSNRSLTHRQVNSLIQLAALRPTFKSVSRVVYVHLSPATRSLILDYLGGHVQLSTLEQNQICVAAMVGLLSCHANQPYIRHLLHFCSPDNAELVHDLQLYMSSGGVLNHTHVHLTGGSLPPVPLDFSASPVLRPLTPAISSGSSAAGD